MTELEDTESAQRKVFMVPHFYRSDAREVTRRAIKGLVDAGIEVSMFLEDADRIGIDEVVGVDEDNAVTGCELVIIFGGDGTILRAAELARGKDVPLFGVNLGHMGFLAEAEPDDLPSVLNAIIHRSYEVEERLAIECEVSEPNGTVTIDWGLNDICVEKSVRERMIEVILAVDGKPLSEWGCDGVLLSTPTGSTAYSWSAGGPVVWPDVEALVVVPISAHALFSRPLVVSPAAEIEIEVMAESHPAVVWCDGRRVIDAPPGTMVQIRRSKESVKLARFHHAKFSDRLVRKFALPISGWRGTLASRSDPKSGDQNG